MPTAATPPTRFAAGDTLRWSFASSDFPASAGWVLSYRLVGTGVALAIAATADGDAFIAEATATATAALSIAAPGVPCSLVGYVTKGAERFQVYGQPCYVLPNPATATGDLRGHAAVTLEAIEALLAGRATKDQESYKIADRELRRIPIPELLRLRDYYKAEAARDASAAAIASGNRPPSRVVTRFAARG